MYTPALIISGGQTGVDIGCLRAAKCVGIPTGGHMPKGFKTENGPRPDWANLFGLLEHWDAGYPPRTETNVLCAHATLIISVRDCNERGSSLTRLICEEQKKPFLFVTINSTNDSFRYYTEEIREFIEDIEPTILNCAGNRESISPGIENWSKGLMIEVLK